MKLIDQILEQMETHRMVTPDGHIFLRKDDVRHVLDQVLQAYTTASEVDTTVVEVDWYTAPKWANWWAMDFDGQANWFKYRPVTFCNRWCCEPKRHGHAPHRKFKGPFVDWQLNIRKRPRVGA